MKFKIVLHQDEDNAQSSASILRRLSFILDRMPWNKLPDSKEITLPDSEGNLVDVQMKKDEK